MPLFEALKHNILFDIQPNEESDATTITVEADQPCYNMNFSSPDLMHGDSESITNYQKSL